jgi:hypothetical protein
MNQVVHMFASTLPKTLIRFLILFCLATLGALAMIDEGPDAEEAVPTVIVDQAKRLGAGPSTATHQDPQPRNGTSHGTFL